MRTLMKVSMPVETSNAALKDGRLPRVMQAAMESLKPEAAYFLAEDGKRTGYFFFDLKTASDIPAIVEPFFMNLNAAVEILPCMNAADLKAGLERAAKAF